MADEAVKYVQLEPDAFLSDSDFQLMNAEERGAYWTIILYLYRNNGKLKNDPISISNLCKVKPDFNFSSILVKFQIKRGYLYHKRVTKEINKAQAKKAAGLRAANVKWETKRNSDAVAMRSQCGRIESAMPTKLNLTKNNYIHSQGNLDNSNRKFTLNEVLAEAAIIGFTDEQAKEFFTHYNSQGWKFGNNIPIDDLPTAMVRWRNHGYKFENKQSVQAGVRDDRSLSERTYEKALKELESREQHG